MKAYQLTAWQHPPELREVEVPEPGPGQVLVKVGGAGACHSDLHLMDDLARGHAALRARRSRSATRTPAGSRRSGAGVTGWRWASRSRCTGPGAADAAARCRLGLENYCERAGRARRVRRRPRPRRRHGGVHARPATRGCSSRSGSRSARRGAAVRRRPDAVPRDQAPLAPARPGHRPPSSSASAASVTWLCRSSRALSPARIIAVDTSRRQARAGARGRRR